jgi:predicted dehydrogenase
VADRTGPVGVGIVGAGNISPEYLANLCRFPDVEVLAIGDVRPDAARQRAAEHGVPLAGEPSVVLAHPDVEIVVNLTTPAAHATVAEEAIAAGKDVWNEKPLALDRASARRLLEAAATAGRRVGCAPDTFLGPGLQAARRWVDGGVIGEPATALALMQQPGPDSWHPNPAFLFQVGAGPLWDVGPYYLAALVQLLGPVASVAGAGSIARPTRVVGSGALAGQPFEVTTPSHVGALLRFAGGGSAQTIHSFDSALIRALLEVSGSEGTLILPDPNGFDGEIRVQRRGSKEPEVLETTVASASRGTGVLEMARAIRTGRPHRADGALAFHVLDTMQAIADAIDERAFVDVGSRVAPAEPLPADWDPFALTLAGAVAT